MNPLHSSRVHLVLWLSLPLLLLFFLFNATAQVTTFSDEILIVGSAFGLNCIFSTDLDGDGDKDLLSAADLGGKIAWYENTDGLGNFGPERIITASADGAQSVYSIDLDGDGDNDVLSASENDNKIAWYENMNSMGSFGPPQIITTNGDGFHSVFSADLDGDEDYDVIAASEGDPNITWYENTDGQGSFGPQQLITNSANNAKSVFCEDIDGDGDYDVLSASSWDDKIAWYENTDGLGSFGPQYIITIGAYGAQSVFSADLDGDGDSDVLSASFNDNKIAWYENTDGHGDFGPQQIVSNVAVQAKSVFSVDLDGDGDNDVISASHDDDKIAWYENIDGLGNFSSQEIITPRTNGAIGIYSKDLDGDGDNDVISASLYDNKIAWYENTDGMGNYGPQKVITTFADHAKSVFSADLDGDGDYDVLSASGRDNKIAWYENVDGVGSFGTQQIITTNAEGANSVFSADLDGDGDYDVLSASYSDDKIAWYENTDGQGNFGLQQIINTNTIGAISVFSVDFDGDGDNDVL